MIGLDYLFEPSTGRLAIIDLNSFPGYEKFPNFYPSLIAMLRAKLDASHAAPGVRSSPSSPEAHPHPSSNPNLNQNTNSNPPSSEWLAPPPSSHAGISTRRTQKTRPAASSSSSDRPEGTCASSSSSRGASSSPAEGPSFSSGVGTSESESDTEANKCGSLVVLTPCVKI